jgi:transcriptional regulator with XRE-family HTH domain
MTVAIASPVYCSAFHHMADSDTDDVSPARQEQLRVGQALRQLRLRYGLTQAHAAERFDVSTQAWQRYESGERRFPDWKLTKLAVAAGGSLEELMVERARLESGGGADVVQLADRGRAFAHNGGGGAVMTQLAGLLGPHSDSLRLAQDDLSPWAESGELIIFDRDRPPRRGHGCVVELIEGPPQVWIFEGRHEGGVRVRGPAHGAQPQPLDGVRGVYAVRFRGD